MTRLNITFEGCEGEVKTVWSEAPNLIKLGDGSLWAFRKRTGNDVVYAPAAVEELTWVRPNKIETEKPRI